jgi:hypothetical protein
LSRFLISSRSGFGVSPALTDFSGAEAMHRLRIGMLRQCSAHPKVSTTSSGRDIKSKPRQWLEDGFRLFPIRPFANHTHIGITLASRAGAACFGCIFITREIFMVIAPPASHPI